MKNKLLLLVAISVAAVVGAGFIPQKKKPSKVQRIILDAGHGGKDPGAPCWENICTEAEIALGATLKLGKTINAMMPDVQVFYTRTDDSYPSLQYRSNYANEMKGDLFISMHCNSVSPKKILEPNGTKTITYWVGKGKQRRKETKEIQLYKTVIVPNPAAGMETYVWSSDKGNQKIQAVADKENEAIFKDPNYKKNYGGGYSINSPEFIAKAKLKTKKYFTRSTTLANYIQDEGANAGRNDRNVRQRGIGIWVLQATAMPSVLVEMGYISNPDERDYLNSEAGQQQQAEIVAKAVKRYKDELDAQQAPGDEPTNNNTNSDSTVAAIIPKKWNIKPQAK